MSEDKENKTIEEEINLKEEELRIKFRDKLKELINSYEEKGLKAIILTTFANRAQNRSCLTCDKNYSCSHFVSECIYNHPIPLDVDDMKVKLSDYIN